jgi:DNA modification methylase
MKWPPIDNPYYCDDYACIIHADCRDILPLLEPVDCVLTDPPYGINWHPRVNHIGKNQLWHDHERPDLSQIVSSAPMSIIWGGNYFADSLPPSGAWLCWVKRPIHVDFSEDARTYATIELAWTNCSTKAAFKCIVWDGGKRQGHPQNRSFCHPSQKPIELMTWCIKKSGAANSILDPFMGSGTTLVAAKNLRRKAIGIELEEKYCAIAVKRLAQEVLPL